MLIAKSKLRLDGHFPELDAFPNTDQWLQIVGFTESALRVSVASLFKLYCNVLALYIIECY